MSGSGNAIMPIALILIYAKDGQVANRWLDSSLSELHALHLGFSTTFDVRFQPSYYSFYEKNYSSTLIILTK
jgi:hypothetical protein